MPLSVRHAPDVQTLANEVAEEIIQVIQERHTQGGAVLALPSGNTPLPVYRVLQERFRHPDSRLDVSRVHLFGLDEYEGLPPEHPQSTHFYLQHEFLEPLRAKGRGLNPSRCHLFRGDLPPREAEQACQEHEALIHTLGGLDLAVLGIGRNGHLAFNEPGTPANAPGGRVRLHPQTRADAALGFAGLEHVPQGAVTLGLRTLLGAKRVLLVATGAHKHDVVERMLHGPVDPELPASHLRHHLDARVYLALGAPRA